jgi:tetratricopeptide (TPR) repeat protein
MPEADPARPEPAFAPGQGKGLLLHRRARISCLEGDLDKAMIDIDSVWEDHQKKAQGIRTIPPWAALMAKVDLWLEMGRFDKAEESLRMIEDLVRARALEYRRARPDFPGTDFPNEYEKSYLDLIQGKIELKRGRLSKAIVLLKNAQFPYFEGSRPAISSCYYLEALGSAYEQAGKLVQARQEYEKILRLTGGRMFAGLTYALSLYRLGKLCERQGDRPQAVEYYGKFVELWKNADRVRPELEDAQSRLAALISR